MPTTFKIEWHGQTYWEEWHGQTYWDIWYVFNSLLLWDELDTILCDKVYDLFRQISRFLQVHLVLSCNKTHFITEMLLKVALNVNTQGQSWSWSYLSWIYNYLCNQYQSPLTLWMQILFRHGAHDTTLCDKDYQWLATGRWFSLCTPVSSTNKTNFYWKWHSTP